METEYKNMQQLTQSTLADSNFSLDPDAVAQASQPHSHDAKSEDESSENSREISSASSSSPSSSSSSSLSPSSASSPPPLLPRKSSLLYRSPSVAPIAHTLPKSLGSIEKPEFVQLKKQLSEKLEMLELARQMLLIPTPIGSSEELP
eukprot:TRINITY_DN7342_c0_g1_i3.p1 TRINITY_DN7342_c0_g1~~TRINITY_DN7342_c0_g1_i3.p1  ORF type:complete len:147 (+),score=43.46 TRINITY_DN7342_c0_g1_i3:129-569(+)